MTLLWWNRILFLCLVSLLDLVINVVGIVYSELSVHICQRDRYSPFNSVSGVPRAAVWWWYCLQLNVSPFQRNTIELPSHTQIQNHEQSPHVLCEYDPPSPTSISYSSSSLVRKNMSSSAVADAEPCLASLVSAIDPANPAKQARFPKNAWRVQRGTGPATGSRATYSAAKALHRMLATFAVFVRKRSP